MEHKAQLASLQQERDTHAKTLAHHDQEMAVLQAKVQQLQTTLCSEKENSSKRLEELRSCLDERVYLVWVGRNY